MSYNYYAGAQGVPYAEPISMGDVMRRVYAWLALGLAFGFGISFVIGQAVVTAFQTGEPNQVFNVVTNPIASIVGLVAYLGLGFTFYPIVRRANLTLGAVLYLLFAGVFGFLISSIWAAYDTGTIFTAFLTTAAMFGAMSVVGFATKMDLSKLGAVLFMALIGLIIASVVNLFLHNSALYWIISYLGVAIFSGLTAYDTQRIRKEAISLSHSGNGQMVGRVALIGAFRLFLDFINLFMFLLSILGGGRRR